MLAKWMTNRKITTGREVSIEGARRVARLRAWPTPWPGASFSNCSFLSSPQVFTKPQTTDNAVRARDALAKHIYAHVFNWVVARINEVGLGMSRVARSLSERQKSLPRGF